MVFNKLIEILKYNKNLENNSGRGILGLEEKD
jgi:hypothetical protein